MERPDEILRLSGQYWESFALHAAVELQLFSLIGGREICAEELAETAGYSTDGTRRILDAMTALGLLKKTGGMYANTEVSHKHLCRGAEQYLGHMIQHHHKLAPTWARLDEAVRTGQPVREEPSSHSDADRESFLMGMFNMGNIHAPTIAARLPLADAETLLDLGGGPGAYAIHFCKAYPQLQATVFDLPTTAGFAESMIEKFGLDERVDFVAGDFVHEHIPGTYDIVWASHILHGEPMSNAYELVEKAAGALNTSGTLIIHEFILNNGKSGPVFPALFSLNMLQGTVGGEAYSQEELMDMVRRAGLSNPEFVELPGNSDLIIARR